MTFHPVQMMRLALGELRPLPRPFILSKMGFDVVHGCQLRCIGCPNATLAPKVRCVSIEDFKACLSNVDADRIDAFRFFNFGEPLLHKSLGELVGCIREFDWDLGKAEISTNAQHHAFDVLADVFKTGQLDILAVSCDGDGTAEEYERLRPPATWEKLLEFLRKAKELRDQYAPSLKLITRTICTDPESQKRWSELLEPMGWLPQFRDWIDLPQAGGESERLRKVGDGVCYFMTDRLFCYADVDGTVVPCCAHPRAFVLGNLRDQKLSQILIGKKRRHLLWRLATSRNSLPVCLECQF